MSTTMPKVAEINRKWYIIDASGKTLGHVAVRAAELLRGKLKTDFVTNVDCGDHVIIINCADLVLTGKKLEQKFHRHHTGWVGGLREIRYDKLMAENPELAMTYAVKGMVPDTTIGRHALTRLRTYAGANHAHAAQQPQEHTL